MATGSQPCSPLPGLVSSSLSVNHSAANCRGQRGSQQRVIAVQVQDSRLGGSLEPVCPKGSRSLGSELLLGPLSLRDDLAGRSVAGLTVSLPPVGAVPTPRWQSDQSGATTSSSSSSVRTTPPTPTPHSTLHSSQGPFPALDSQNKSGGTCCSLVSQTKRQVKTGYETWPGSPPT